MSGEGGDGGGSDAAVAAAVPTAVWILLFFLLFSILGIQLVLFIRSKPCQTDDAEDEYDVVPRRGDARFQAREVPGVVVDEERIIHVGATPPPSSSIH
jgi:hypothetical protein